MLRPALTITLLLTLTGCAGQPVQYAKDGAVAGEFDRDHWECKQQWNQTGPAQQYARDPLGNLYALTTVRPFMRECLTARGWQAIEAPADSGQ